MQVLDMILSGTEHYRLLSCFDSLTQGVEQGCVFLARSDHKNVEFQLVAQL